MPKTPDRIEEALLWSKGYHRIAGVDEVGRGPLAGPVMAAAVVLPQDWAPFWMKWIRDSKALTPNTRKRLEQFIRNAGVPLGLGAAQPEEIDQNGIVVATHLAMTRAIAAINPPPDFLLVDGIQAPPSVIPHKAIVRGDTTCLPIAAASIVAKVARDQLMVDFHATYPQYGFAHHKGYPTAAHIAALKQFGPSPLHRRRFGPVRRMLEDKAEGRNRP